MRLNKAIKEMRALTKRNVPFSIGFITCNTTSNASEGYKIVDKVLLRKGYSKAHSKKWNSLIAYTDVSTDKQRQFHLPLLIMFNGNILQL